MSAVGIFGAIGDMLGGGVAQVGKVFFGSKEERDAAASTENLAGMGEFSSEFADKTNRTWWDSCIDGINRLMRPSMWFSTIGLFWLAPINPEKFAAITAALALIPAGMWYTLMIMVGFLFPSRIIEKMDMSNMAKGFGIDDARQRLGILKELKNFTGTDADAQAVGDDGNPSIAAWKALQQ